MLWLKPILVHVREGQGVPQDNAMAHMWFNIGAANGNQRGGTNRDKIAKKMTTAAIEKAQAMARECMNSGYHQVWVLRHETITHRTHGSSFLMMIASQVQLLLILMTLQTAQGYW